MSTTANLLERLRAAGFSEDCVRAALPEWWSAEEENSSSAQTLVALLLARRLSLDPQSLLNEQSPVGFLHAGPTKFKHLRLGDGARLRALTAFSQGVARIIFAVMSSEKSEIEYPSANEMRSSVLASGRSRVAFGDVLSLCWSLEIPVIHLRLFPARTKGITAMAVRIGSRFAILVARETGIPAQYMFHVAHELGHIALGHLADAATIVDADPNDPENQPEELVDDAEEQAADAFAQELLSGKHDFRVQRAGLQEQSLGTARELAERAISVGEHLRVDPGHVVMTFGDATGEWGLAMAAAKLIPDQLEVPGTLVNKVFWSQIQKASDYESLPFLRAVAVA